jgi:hypothetical protein
VCIVLTKYLRIQHGDVVLLRGLVVFDEPVVIPTVRVPDDVVQHHQPLELQLEPGQTFSLLFYLNPSYITSTVNSRRGRYIRHWLVSVLCGVRDKIKESSMDV